MTFGGWSISRTLFERMLDEIPEGAQVVELGSGAASRSLALHWSLLSYEHDAAYLASTSDFPEWRIVHAPLRGGWYDPDIIRSTIPKRYAALLIDGPPTGRRRLHMLSHLDLFDWTARIFIDDMHRAAEVQLANRLAAHVGRPLVVVRCAQKSFGIL